jgi:hypothetical protein
MGWRLTCLSLLTLDVVCTDHEFTVVTDWWSLVVCHFSNVHVSTWEMCTEYKDNVAMCDNCFIWCHVSWEARYWLSATRVLLNVPNTVNEADCSLIMLLHAMLWCELGAVHYVIPWSAMQSWRSVIPWSHLRWNCMVLQPICCARWWRHQPSAFDWSELQRMAIFYEHSW